MKNAIGSELLARWRFLLLGMYFPHTNLLLDAEANPLPLMAQ